MASRSVDGRSAGGAVACPHWLATETGRDVLAAGGNALDAAVAMNAMLAVVYPHMCGLGGDLFLLYADARTGRIHCLNASGPAPALANALRDATGVRFTEPPFTADRVWQRLRGGPPPGC
jgi:gamma-glutamyltranspeptidase/glutathione hydrolase